MSSAAADRIPDAMWKLPKGFLRKVSGRVSEDFRRVSGRVSAGFPWVSGGFRRPVQPKRA